VGKTKEYLDRLKIEDPEKYEAYKIKNKERQRKYLQSDKGKELRKRINSTEKVKEIKRLWAKNNPEKAKTWKRDNPEKVKKANETWRKNNPEKVKESQKQYRYSEKGINTIKQHYKNNSDSVKESSRRWRKDNSYKKRLQSIKEKERNSGIEPIITEQDLINILDKFEHKCFNCGSTEELVYDHFYPIKYKIPLSKENCVILCTICNFTQKRSKQPEEFFNKKQLKKLYSEYGIKKLNLKEEF